MSSTQVTGKANLAAIFSGLKDAKVQVGAVYVRPGRYWARINKCKMDKSRKNQEFAAIEMTILKVADNDQGKGHKVGDEVTHMIMRANDYFLSEIKGFIAGVFGVKPELVQDENAIMVFDDGQPLRNYVVDINAYNVVTKKSTDFTRIKYDRRVPFGEVLGALDAEAANYYFPDGALKRLAEFEAAQAAQAKPA